MKLAGPWQKILQESLKQKEGGKRQQQRSARSDESGSTA